MDQPLLFGLIVLAMVMILLHQEDLNRRALGMMGFLRASVTPRLMEQLST
jgi:hypothetical protein